jgi:MFS family permease
MHPTSSRLTLIFSSLGHAYMHLLAAYFFVVVLPLEREWQIPYHELIELWTVGALLIGLAALPAGWLSDRWSAAGMMVVFFVGLGVSAIVCGLARSPTSLWVGLCLLGTFASIYHPVGIPWLVRTSTTSRGKALGVNGIFGSVGVAGAGIVAGALIDASGWRAAFIVPGVVSVATGVAMLLYMRAGLLTDAEEAVSADLERDGASATRAFAILQCTMLCGSLVYHSAQVALPKLFALRLEALVGGSAFGIGSLIAFVYGMAALTQVTAGHVADRWPLKPVYASAFLLQVPLFWLISRIGGPALVLTAGAALVVNTGALPAENMLLAAATPRDRHGLVFGLKFVLAFGAAPLSIWLVSGFADSIGGFGWIFSVLALLAAIGCLAALLLPRPVARLAPPAAAT